MRGARADPEPVQHDGADVVGVLDDRHERPGTGLHRARPEQQHGEHTVAHPAADRGSGTAASASTSDNTAGIGTQPGHHLIEVGVRLVEGSNDRRG